MQKKLNRICDEHMQAFLFLICWLVYFASYIGRLNYSSAMPAMIEDSVLTASQAGFISMAYFFAYGAGQFLNGMLSDRLCPGRMIFTGLFAAGLLNLIMGFLSDFGLMAFFWCINGYAQAMIWPPIMRIFAQVMTKEKRERYCVHITSTMAAGTFTSYLLSAVMNAIAGWRFVFYAAAVCMCASAVIFHYGFARVEAFALKYGKQEEIDRKGDKPMPFLKLLKVSGLFFLLMPVVVHGMLKDGVTSWIPTYISEIFIISPTISMLVTAVLPIVNLTGAYAAQFMYRKFFHRQEIKTVAFFFLIAVISLIFLWRFGAVNMFLTIGLLSVITASMMAVNTLFVNLLPLRFERERRVSTVSGFLNSTAYLGCAVSVYGIGVLIQGAGWEAVELCWLLVTAAALIICFVLRNKKFAAGSG